MVIITRLTFTYLHRLFTSKKEKKKKTCKCLSPSVRWIILLWCNLVNSNYFCFVSLMHASVLQNNSRSIKKREKKLAIVFFFFLSRIVGCANIFIKFRPQLDTEWVSSQSHWFNKIVICQITSLIKILIKLNTFISF